MDKKIITIGRQYGSGGREIGEQLAKELGISCYDTSLITQVAQKSGLCEKVINEYDETATGSILYSIYAMTLSNAGGNIDQMPVNARVFFAQFEAIKDIASKESAVIVGRCADYVLRDWENVFNVFITSDLEKRIARVAQRNNINENEASRRIAKKDKHRASYYNYYTNQKWGMASNYHCCLDSGIYGIEGTVKILLEIMNMDIGVEQVDKNK